MTVTGKRAYIITKNFPPIICGVGDYSYQLYKRLVAEGIDTEVISSITNDADASLLQPNAIFIKGRWGLSTAIYIWKHIKKKPGTVFLQYVPYNYSKLGLPLYLLVLVFMLRLSRVKVVTYFHEVAVRLWRSGFLLFFLGFAQRLLAYIILLISKSSATSNRYYYSLLQPFKVQLLPISSNFESVQSNDANDTKKEYIFTFINRCTYSILQAFSVLLKTAPHIQLYIAGKDHISHTKQIKEWITRLSIDTQVRLLGVISEKEMVDYIKNAHIFLQNEFVTSYGGGGISTKNTTIAAAFQLGLPVITTSGDMTDTTLFKNGDNCMLVKYDDANAITNAMEILLKNKEYRLQLAKNAEVTYKQEMSWENTFAFFFKYV